MAMLLALQSIKAQQTLKSTIKTVQVYTQGAEIQRTAKVKLKAGRNELKLEQLSAFLDPKTIQIGAPDLTILSVKHELDYLSEKELPEKLVKLNERKEHLQDSMAYVNVRVSLLKKEIQLLDKNMTVVGDQGIQNQEFRNAVDYFSQRFEKLYEAELLQKQKLQGLKEKMSQIEKQLAVLNATKKEPVSNILVTLESDKVLDTELKINYAVKNAGWFPAYDIRATNTNSPIEMTYKAQVYQNSGIDWDNVKLRISSGDLQASGTAPQLGPYYLFRPKRYGKGAPNSQVTQVSGVVKDTYGEAIPYVSVAIKGTTLGTITDANGRYSLQLPTGANTLQFSFVGYHYVERPVINSVLNVQMDEDASALDEVVVVGEADSFPRTLRGTTNGLQKREVKLRGQNSIKALNQALDYEQINYQTSFVYDIELPYSIASTGQPETVDITTKALEVDYVYYAAPKARASAFLVARVANWTDLNLLDGESNLYFEDRFVGKSLIDTSVGLDTLSLSLGKDDAIIVNRERKRDFEQRKFFGSKKREERHYEITLLNTKKEAVQIELQDQIPLTSRDNVKVQLLESSNGQLNKDSGLLTWKLLLQPGQKQVIQLKYAVEYPKNMNVEID